MTGLRGSLWQIRMIIPWYELGVAGAAGRKFLNESMKERAIRLCRRRIRDSALLRPRVQRPLPSHCFWNPVGRNDSEEVLATEDQRRYAFE